MCASDHRRKLKLKPHLCSSYFVWNSDYFVYQLSALDCLHFLQNCTKQARLTQLRREVQWRQKSSLETLIFHLLGMVLLSCNKAELNQQQWCKDRPNDRLPYVLSNTSNVSIYFWLKFSRFTLRYVIKVITLVECDNIINTTSSRCSLSNQLKVHRALLIDLRTWP